MPVSAGTACPSCGSPLVTITINVGAGERSMCSCSTCDMRWWQRDGKLTTLDGVIHELGTPDTPRARFRR